MKCHNPVQPTQRSAAQHRSLSAVNIKQSNQAASPCNCTGISLKDMSHLLMATSTDRTEIVWDSSSECLMRLSLLNCKMNTTHRKSLQNKHEQKDKKKLVRMENLPY